MVGETPGQGDYGFISPDPARGHEQAGKRPVIVVSCDAFKSASGLTWVVPVTTKVKGRPGEILFPDGMKFQGSSCLNICGALIQRRKIFNVWEMLGKNFWMKKFREDYAQLLLVNNMG